jgi:hypothetical protein
MDRKFGTLRILKTRKPKKKSQHTLESPLLGGSDNGAVEENEKKSVDQANVREID